MGAGPGNHAARAIRRLGAMDGDDAGERLGAMVEQWAEAWRREHGADLPREDALRAFAAGAVAVIEHWDEVRPLAPRRRRASRDRPMHH